MRAACVDRRLIMPTAEQWILQRGAYRDGQDLVLPVVDALVNIFLPVNRSVRDLYWSPQVFVPGGGKNQLYERANYYGADRVTSVLPTVAAGGNAPILPVDQWTVAPAWLLRPGSAVSWLNLSLSVTSNYGVPGTRFRPGPSDITVTRL